MCHQEKLGWVFQRKGNKAILSLLAQPMNRMEKRIYISPPHLEESSVKGVVDALESNWIAPVGPSLDDFEKKIHDETGAYPVLTTSGEAALELLLRLHDVGQGDVVITASHTCNATVNAILHLGATPVFIDSDPEHWNMSGEYLSMALSTLKKSGILPRIKAILFVHIYGNPEGLDDVVTLGKEYSIFHPNNFLIY